MQMNEIKLNIELRGRDDRFRKGKVVSWENLSVVTKKNLQQSVKSSICFQDTSKYEKPLLNKINGLVKPGEMVALMGARLI